MRTRIISFFAAVLIAAVLIAVSVATPAAAVTPKIQYDKIEFEVVNYQVDGFTDNEPASGNKTRIKGVSCWMENMEWGYLHISWRAKSKAQGYQIEISKDNRFAKAERGSAWRTTCTKTFGAFSSPKSGDTYNIRVRAVYKNDKVGPWSKTAKITKK